MTYAWSNGSTATTVDVQPEVTTTYTVTATVNNENGSCTFNGEVTIIVTPRPATVVVTATTDTICEGQQITFNASGNAYSIIAQLLASIRYAALIRCQHRCNGTFNTSLERCSTA